MKLLGTGNSKTVKGEKKGWTTYVMYLSPHKQNSKGKNLCPKASDGCSEACLFTAGRGRMKSIQEARIRKTELFLDDKHSFITQLSDELATTTLRHIKKKENYCVRLNGTSDVPWENVKYDSGLNVFEIHSHIQFYDYTKDPRRVRKNTQSNYHLTFSRSENNQDECMKLLNEGYNVAMVFNEIPDTYEGYKVVNGDEDDLRFLDESGVIVGLKAKGDAKKDTSGFVI